LKRSWRGDNQKINGGAPVAGSSASASVWYNTNAFDDHNIEKIKHVYLVQKENDPPKPRVLM
jgi:hypothetical protein